jgi:predicted hydrocarbon binding protein
MNNKARQKCLSLFERTEYYDDEGEWQIAGSDWLLMSGSTLRSWAKVTEQILGSGAKAIAYMAGKHAGEQFAKMLLKEGLTDEELKCALEVFLTNGGWGKVRAKLNFQKRTAVVRIRNSVTTRQTKSNEPVCHFISGFTAGALTIIFSKKAECVEIMCKAKGDPFCEFRVGGKVNVD